MTKAMGQTINVNEQSEIDRFILEGLELCEKATEGPWYIQGPEVRYDCSPETTGSWIGDCTIQICEVSRINEDMDDFRSDRAFIAHSRTALPKALMALQIAVEALNKIGHTIDSSDSDTNGGPCRVSVANSRNRRIIEAQDAITEIEKVLK